MNLDEVEVLLVEDSDEDAELTIRALKKHRLANHLHRVSDGAEALDFLFREGTYPGRAMNGTPRVVLLDLKLPKLDGLEVLRRMKASDSLKSIPVVVLTSSKEDRDLVGAYALGVNSYIVKPVLFDKFVEAVEQLGQYWLLLNERGTP